MGERPRGQRYATIAAVLLALLVLAGCKTYAPAGAAFTQPRYRAEYRYAKRIFHIHGGEKRCLIALWDRESGWSADAVNPSSGAYGIPQALPSVHGHPFALGDWKTQIRWGRSYIARRYGDPCTALAHEDANGWY